MTAPRPGTPLPAPSGDGPRWWDHAVVYQVYVRSFADSDGDGLGDLPGITARLPYLRDLGVDAVWLTPFYVSPQRDHGYDVADHCDVDPRFGTLADADRLLATAHDLGLRVIVDLVPNHTSSEHPWFRAALAAGPDSPERAHYLFRTGRGVDGAEPPNNWQSVFGKPAWTRVGDTDQWYLHLFDSSQPDLDWRNPEVWDLFDDTLRFWLARGVDGFRVDVAHGLFKEESLRDQEHPTAPGSGAPAEPAAPQSMVERDALDEPMWDQPEVHEVYRHWRRVLAEHGPDRMAVAEAWTRSPESLARFVRPDELHQAFNFAWLLADWSAAAFAEVLRSTFAAIRPVGASPTWVLSNHDVVRHPTRYGGGPVGLARARAATVTMLGLPGACYLYQGEELGLEEVDVPPEHRQDPSWFRTGEPGRDGCRVPVPWGGERPPYDFGPGEGQPWLPQPAHWAGLSVAAQTGREGSTLELYRTALRLRRSLLDTTDTTGSTDSAGTRDDEVTLEDGWERDVLAFRRAGLLVVLNCGGEVVPLPPGEVLLCSDPGRGTHDLLRDGLPPDTAVWLRPAAQSRAAL